MIGRPARNRPTEVSSFADDGPDDRAGAADDVLNVSSASRIGEANRRRVLQTLFDIGPTSRAELARLAGTNRTTISGIVQPLLESGLLVEEAPLMSRGVGKPPRPLWFSRDAAPVCAVTVMADGIRAAMVSIDGEPYSPASASIDDPSGDPGAIVSSIERCVRQSLAGARGLPIGVGIAVGGMVDTARGEIVAMNLVPALAGVRLGRAMEEAVGLPTVLDHHPRAVLLGERWFGEGRGLGQFAVVYTGEVLGCALYLDGRLLRGPLGSGGELGHTVVDLRGERCLCGKRGCWETIATLPWLRRRAAALGMEDPQGIDARRLSGMSDAGDAAARELMLEYAHNVAVGIANLQTLLMPGSFIVHGDVARGTPSLHRELEDAVKRLSPRHPGVRRRVIFGTDEAKTTLRGAAGLVISDRLQIEY